VSFFHRLTHFFLLGLLLSNVCSGGEKRPNIVLVFIDDMGWADFSCFGNEDAKTPNIDQLANEGIRFEQFYVNSPICSPSRVAISTGQYPQRWKISSYLGHRTQNEKRGMAQWLDPQAPMLARFLQSAGYATGHFGKWHMGGQRDVKDAPAITEYGFDQSLTNFEGIGPKLLPLTLKPGQDPKKPGRIWQHAEHLGDGYQWIQRSEITGGFVDAALPFIDQAKKDGKPFYLNLWPDDVHSPYWPPVDKWGDGKKRTLYLAVLEEMDRQLGKLFDRVRKDPELADNTMILICSDNGPDPGAGSAEPLRGYKTHLYEGGIRSPLVVWAPGLMNKESAGTVNKTSVFSAMDLVPSLADLCNVPLPRKVIFDGEELIDVLLGESKRSRKEPIFFRRPPDRDSFFGVENLPDLAVRSGKWKLLSEYDGSNAELYDLSTDPGESNDLAGSQPGIRDQIVEQVTNWHNSMPTDNGPSLVGPFRL
jgi:arylsulfatase A-like enzyme